MYLEFIADIANIGDVISVECNDGSIQGTIVKISASMVAIKLSSGVVVIKKDSEILNVVLNPTDKEVSPEETSAQNAPLMSDEVERLNPEISSKATKQASMDDDLTVGQYEGEWDSIDRDGLLRQVQSLRMGLTDEESSLIVTENAYLREVCKRSLKVNANGNPKFPVLMSSIIERSLITEIRQFNIGDTLPLVLYFHKNFSDSKVFITLSPNNIFGYIYILEDAIKNGHYRQGKSLCYFLLSVIKSKRSRGTLFSLVSLLKPVNAFFKEAQKETNEAVKMPKAYKEIEKKINMLVREGNLSEAISLIDETLDTHIDSKYRSSLLLRKAQAYSALQDYANAKSAYMALITYKEQTKGEPNNLSHLYTELARLQAIEKDNDAAIASATKALSYNPQNKYGATLLEQLKTGTLKAALDQVAITAGELTGEENNELMLDSEESNIVISKMIDIDIKEHQYTTDSILANGGNSTTLIAEEILSEAQSSARADMGEKYPLYLEAAKAFSELPIGSYDYSRYIESVAFYAVYKANYLFSKFRKEIESNQNPDIKPLKVIRDSACSYYIQSLNLLSNVKSGMLGVILCNYIKLNVAIINAENDRIVSLSGSFNKVFLDCINSNNPYIKEVVWRTIAIVGAASSNAWNHLWRSRDPWRKEFYKAIKDERKRPDIYKTINEQNRSEVNESLSPGSFFKQIWIYRANRVTKFNETLASIQRENLDFHNLSYLLDKWSEVNDYLDLMNETELSSKSVVDGILNILKPYLNRNQAERTNILIQAQQEIEDHIRFINENTTFYGRTFFFALLKKWKNTIKQLLEKKIADTLPKLCVIADPPYIVMKDGSKVINLLIKNDGESTAEGCYLEPTLTDIETTNQIKGRNEIKKEIPAGGVMEIPMKLPANKLSSATKIKLSMSISAIYQGRRIDASVYDFTVETEPTSTLRYEDIPWRDGPIPAEHMFKGRKGIIDMLSQHYTSIEKDKPYILYGLTRTGKSSILKYLKQALDKTTISVNGDVFTLAIFDWDLSEAASFGNAPDMWEYLLYVQLNEFLESYIGQQGINDLRMPERPKAKDLKKTLSFLHKRHIYPIFFVDEFSFIKALMDKGTLNNAFLHTLRQYSFEGEAGFIYAGTYDVDALLDNPDYGITGQLVGCKRIQINEIDKSSAEELMQVMGDKLMFTDDAIEHLHKLSGDVPYFIQMICKNCGFYAVENKRAIIGYPELEGVIQILTGEKEEESNSLVKKLPENVFQNNMFSPADPKEVSVLISSICYFNRQNVVNPRGVSMVELQKLWGEKNISAYRPILADSIALLNKKKVLSTTQDEGLPVYSLNVDLFRRWWTVHHPDIALEIDTIL